VLERLAPRLQRPGDVRKLQGGIGFQMIREADRRRI
jgi:hypothetical protein